MSECKRGAIHLSVDWQTEWLNPHGWTADATVPYPKCCRDAKSLRTHLCLFCLRSNFFRSLKSFLFTRRTISKAHSPATDGDLQMMINCRSGHPWTNERKGAAKFPAQRSAPFTGLPSDLPLPFRSSSVYMLRNCRSSLRITSLQILHYLNAKSNLDPNPNTNSLFLNILLLLAI